MDGRFDTTWRSIFIMRSIIVIPARYASSRLPGKPLLRSTGKYLIQHVYERACRCRGVDDVIVATDDSRIFSAVRSFGGRVMMTRRDHTSGTDRVAEVAARVQADIIVNVQGDEPLIEPEAVDQLPHLLKTDPKAELATLATPIHDVATYRNPNVVKVVCDQAGRAMYFSRSPIPYFRDGEPQLTATPPLVMQHLGLYAYRRAALMELATLPPHPLEEAEKLEQLRALGQGWIIRVGLTAHAGRGVDTFDDYQRFRETCRGFRRRMAA
jgi:3-deoxy-manno-octulosonate cytidylyltransferase (CMP-KDO synthetase)